jgi:uncharacterized Fe-S cluster protein YjdI
LFKKIEMKKEYSNGEITITWEPDKCIHSTKCWKELGSVFQPRSRPWISMEGSTTENIVAQIKKCPSGALGYYETNKNQNMEDNKSVKINVLENGPILIEGSCIITEKGNTKTVEKMALCRCGASSNKPFCDGQHNKIGFKG